MLFSVSVFVFLCGDNFFQIVLVGTEEPGIVEIHRLFPRVRHQMESTCFENCLLDFHLFEVAQASRALIEHKAGLRRDELTEQFRITKVDFDVVHAEYTLVRCWKVGIVHCLRSIVVRVVLDMRLALSERRRRAVVVRVLRRSDRSTFWGAEKKVLTPFTKTFVSARLVLNPFIWESQDRERCQDEYRTVLLPSFS